ncbi:enoyl-CoA hydratase/isomerase family protein [Mycolicibacterium peregrinum]|uniref:enoyl-CoA hydratase/isomerase family protein n=1 Tax=Mycolicibacterium peregrinum TaxID=43304 RepID=UPI001F227C2B|nr:enoyl-CoA hydratase/isomerase family protein [Mycolicibacterium peregrinum]
MSAVGPPAGSAPEVVLSRPRAGLILIELNRPHRLNALTATMVESLHQALAEAGADLQCRVVVLSGVGRGFCAGLDLNGYGQLRHDPNSGDVQAKLSVQRHIASLVQRIRALPQPVIASVNGAAAGGGLALVCACDVRLASVNAEFAVSFIRVGFSGCDIGTSWMLPRLVGAGRAHELMLTGRRFDAAEALRIGLVSDVVTAVDLPDRVSGTVDALLAAPPLSLALTKQAMWLSLEIPSLDAAIELENRQQVLTALTQDQAEAMTAFRDGRKPKYSNR